MVTNGTITIKKIEAAAAILAYVLISSYGFIFNGETQLIYNNMNNKFTRRCNQWDRTASINHGEVPVACIAIVDYSAVNEYVEAHYQQKAYFGRDRVEQQIYDGRLLQAKYEHEYDMLKDNGLAIIASPLQETIEWTDRGDIRCSYIANLEKMLQSLYPNMMGCCFWNPMLRGESYSISRPDSNETPTANIASMVHIDTDIGAFDLSDLLDIVDKNSVYQSTYTLEASSFRQSAEDMIQRKKRFVIINFWRNIGPEPVSSAPLAIFSARYDNNLAFPYARPSHESKWYIFPNTTNDEVILFYQYDRNALQISDLFHCAISTSDKIGEGRKSFDIRALVLLNEDVPEELDRYKDCRTRPALSFDESGCFCDEQAEKRKR